MNRIRKRYTKHTILTNPVTGKTQTVEDHTTEAEIVLSTMYARLHRFGPNDPRTYQKLNEMSQDYRRLKAIERRVNIPAVDRMVHHRVTKPITALPPRVYKRTGAVAMRRMIDTWPK